MLRNLIRSLMPAVLGLLLVALVVHSRSTGAAVARTTFGTRSAA